MLRIGGLGAAVMHVLGHVSPPLVRLEPEQPGLEFSQEATARTPVPPRESRDGHADGVVLRGGHRASVTDRRDRRSDEPADTGTQAGLNGRQETLLRELPTVALC